VAAAALGVFAAPASAVVFTNSSTITINDNANATPYPSNIVVSGVSGNVTDVNVTLNDFTHSFPDDVGVVLVGPTGAALLLQDGAGDDPDVNAIDTTFNDSAAGFLPNLTAWASGSYRPTAYYAGDAFPDPGPGTAYVNPGASGGGRLASTFNGTSPNGTWSLYVRDFVGGDSGSIAGWSLELNNPPPPPPPPPGLGVIPQQPVSGSCAGKGATKVGTGGADTIVGTPGADVIAGLGGHDTIKGKGGDDKLCGGGGADTLKGGAGIDVLKGGGGADTCQGGGGVDGASSCQTKRSIP
jgi:Ca2+-binding RTX toxin-like protein